MTEQLLTVQQLSFFLSMHPNTIYKLNDEGRIPSVYINRSIRFNKKDIDDWLKKNKRTHSDFQFSFTKCTLLLKEYDRIFLKGESALSKNNSKRWSYGFGTVYLRKTKQGKIRYYLDYLDKSGKRKRQVVKQAQTRAEAVIALQRKITEILDSSLSPTRIKRISFLEFSKLYLENYSKPTKKSWKCDFYCLNAQLLPYFGEFELQTVSSLQIENYRAERLNDGVQKSTTNRELALLKKMFNLAIDWGYCEKNPSRKVKLFSEKDNLKEQILSENEEKRLLAESAEHLKPIIITALHTGMRRNEILNLKWNQVDLKSRVILVVKTKSGKNRTVPINEFLFEVFNGLREHRTSDYVFPNPEGEPFRSIRHSFENACRRAEIKMRFHDLRHSFACRLIQRGCDIETLRTLLGHHSVTVTERYIHTNEEQKRKAVEFLSAEKTQKTAEKRVDLSHICHMDREKPSEKDLVSLFSVN